MVEFRIRNAYQEFITPSARFTWFSTFFLLTFSTNSASRSTFKLLHRNHRFLTYKQALEDTGNGVEAIELTNELTYSRSVFKLNMICQQ